MEEAMIGSPAVTGADLSDVCPQATHLMALLGEPVDDAFISAFAKRYGNSWLQRFVKPARAIHTFQQTSRVAFGRKYWELLELLILEHWISTNPRAIARSLGKDTPFDKELITLRGHIALALYSRAKSVNWQEPLTFLRALRVAEYYLRSVLDHQHLLKAKRMREYEGRLGVAMVLQARYADLGVDGATEMVAHLRSSIAAGNVKVDAYVYLAEALLRLHDSTGDPLCLTELVALRKSASVRGRSDTLDSHIAEAWFRLSQEASTPDGVDTCRAKAAAICKKLRSCSDPLVQGRIAIINAFLDVVPSTPSPAPTILARGLRTPFGVKAQVRAWRRANSELTLRLLRAIDEQLAHAPKTVVFTPMLRSLAASVESEIAGLLVGRSWLEQKIQYLVSAVNLRDDTPELRALKDPESRLENAVDRFELFRSTGQRAYLVAAIRDTLSLIEFDQAWPTPLLLLARELDSMEEPLPMQVAYELRKIDAGSARSVLAHVLSGNVAEIYALAATRALASREVDRKHLGGRSGVYLAEDYSGIVAETFVFKPTTQALAEREGGRVTRLEQKLRQMGLDERFSAPLTLATSELPRDDLLRRRGYEVLVARQFHFGTILPDALAGADLAMRTTVLESVARFLAVIHSSESREGEPGRRMRQDLLRKDFGRWLRSGMQLKNWQDLFDQWLTIFEPDAVPLARRDAHPLNWLITPGRNVVAVDFEACGWRPAGYELAQLLDDRPLLQIDEVGWKARLHILKQYRRAMQKYGFNIDHNHLVRAWEASTISRAVGALTSPTSDPNLRQHGEDLLTWLGQHSESSRIRGMADELRQAWSVRRGAMTAQEASRLISDSRRRHLSTGMAYELRHGNTVLLDRGGWAYIAAVSDALNGSGLRTDPAEVLAVGGAIDEPRFEIAGKRIRARYGHTVDVEISYQDAFIPSTLYHGTASSNLQAIFSEGEGLRAMGRQWVHLSSDPIMALRTAKRHGPGVLLALESKHDAQPIYHAGGSVYLTSEVASSALRIVSPTELFLTATPAPALFSG